MKDNTAHMRKTKIICTLGPATDDREIMRRLAANGMNVARLNFSHGSHDEHLKRVEMFKEIRDTLRVPMAIMLDTRGPEIRIRQFVEDRVSLAAGSVFTFTVEDVPGTERMVSVAYDGFPGIVRVGDTLLLDDGLIAMKVTAVSGMEVVCRVMNGGALSNNKKINIPGAASKMPFITEKDRDDLMFGIRNDFDFIAASFVRNADDINGLRDILIKNRGDSIKIVAKIEIRDGVDNIDDIIRVSDGIMVARGDMGVEIPFEELPAIQKMIIRKCYSAGKPVITATQMLDSMIRNPRPTRAEITDVANAIYDGTSAIMLSGETSVGRYPVDSLLTMSKIAVEAERDIDYVARFTAMPVAVSGNVTNAISRATCETAHSLGAAAIVSVTKSGRTANMVSKFRPACPILAATTSAKVRSQLSLSWGVYPFLTERKTSTDEVFDQAISRASETDWVRNGDCIVITGGMIADVSGTTNMLKVHIVGDLLLEGIGVSPQTASGPVCVITDADDIRHFNTGDVMVIRKATDDIMGLIKHAAAVITEESANSWTAGAGTEIGIPVVCAVNDAAEILKSGAIVTVDGSNGKIYSGRKNFG